MHTPSPVDPADTSGDSAAFLKRISLLAGTKGAAVVGAGGEWLLSFGPDFRFELDPSLFTTVGHVASARATELPGFVLVVPVPLYDEQKPLWVLLWDDRPRSKIDGHVLLVRVTELVAHAAMARRRAADKHRSALIERASATARIGIWRCSLPDGQLTWTQGVYDLFELPRGMPIDRQMTLGMYTPDSARQMQELRAEAIATLGDFNFDAEIITAKGNRRWMRITATVDGVDGKARSIFGMKQNITEEKLMAERTRRLAETDVLTGLANRSLFNARLEEMQSQRRRFSGALLLIDLDDFKHVNDSLGHAFGDECLAEAGRRLQAIAPSGATVARIGGDEFAILTDGSEPEGAEALSAAVIRAFEAPFILAGAPRRVGASLGIAYFAGQTADVLYHDADTALYSAKSAGRGTWRKFKAA